MRIGIVAPSGPIARETAETVSALAAAEFPGVTLAFHPQCFLAHGHFAGDDRVREEALVETANDPAVDAIWFARGGYGACRIAEPAIARLGEAARDKAWLGYSDAGYLLSGLFRFGFGGTAHGPMPQDIRREKGDQAVRRALSWLAHGEPAALEPNAAASPSLAFNITVFGLLLGTPLEPDLAGRVLMLEDVSEHLYRTDRAMFHITSNPSVRRCAGIRLGRCSEVPANDPDFGATEEEVIRYWCERSGIPFLGRADIGHDSGNKIVPFRSPGRSG